MDRLTKKDFNFTTDFIKRDIDSWSIAQCLKKLQEYEDAEEQGLLMRLPCKVGDMLYAIDGNNIQILEAQNDIALVSGELCLFAENERFADYVCYKDIGRTVFFTQAEAEQKLKKIEDK